LSTIELGVALALQMPKPNSPFIRRRLFYNALSGTLDILDKFGLMKQPLEAELLIAAARRRVRLDDSGDEIFREPLRRLLDCCECEAHLNSIGKLALAGDLLQLLINRLETQRDRQNWPGIGEEAIVAPLFILGLPRTGTTLLHSLLAQDHCTFSAPTTWEVMFPSPPPSFGANGRIQRAERRLGCFHLLAPEFRKIHPVAADLPQECIAIMSHTFVSDQFAAMYHIPTYGSWLKQQDMRPVYQFHRQFLQHLQYGQPTRRFVLKAPVHMLSLETLFATYPDAVVVQTHRDPLEILPSAASLTTVLRSIFSDFVDPAVIGNDMTKFWEDALDKFFGARKHLPDNAFLDVEYSELVRDPIEMVRSIYSRLGHKLSGDVEVRMRAFLSAHPNGKHGNHSYTLAAFGIDSVKLSERFSSYRSSLSRELT
jgi:hypothetical protein